MCNILFTYAKKGQITVNKVVTGNRKEINYGCLYNWWAVNDARGIAPSGWHVPTYAEYGTLQTYLGGQSISGGKLKESGFTHWNSPNTGADNSSGFTARGSGVRAETTGIFASLGIDNYLWTDYSQDATTALHYRLYSTNDNFDLLSAKKARGESVRLIKDDSTDTGSMTDYEGNVYPTVKIGDQVWMAANLIVKHYNNGDAIANVTDNTAWSTLTTGAWCHYSNTQSNSYIETAETLDDNNTFSVTITGQRAVRPKIETKDFSQDSPAVFTSLPYDTYIITESAETGYSLTSIVPDEVTLWGGNKAETITITNNKD